MPSFTFTSPDGQKYTVNGPDGATQDQAFQILQGQSAGRQRAAGLPRPRRRKRSSVPRLRSEARGGGYCRPSWRYRVGYGRGGSLGGQQLGIAPQKNISDLIAPRESDGRYPMAGASWRWLPTTGQVHEAVSGAGVPDYEPETTAGKYAQTIGEFVPARRARPGKEMARSPSSLASFRARHRKRPGRRRKERLIEPYARAAAGVGAGLAPAAGGAQRPGGDGLRRAVYAEGRQNIAARGFRDTFTDPRQAQIDLEAAKARSSPGAAWERSFPGSRPTTGQLTGDQGALQLERALPTKTERRFTKTNMGPAPISKTPRGLRPSSGSS